MEIRLSKIIAPAFYEVHRAIKDGKYTHYRLEGGRGSTKSTFAAVEIILGMMQDPDANAVAIRKVGLYLADSVYEQLCWAISALGVDKYWHEKKSPLELIYKPTGQRILFRGADKPQKLKSTKVRKGYIKYIWYEEVDEFRGQEEIDNINQSLMRGGDKFCVFYSNNPPKSVQAWVNQIPRNRADTYYHHSTYLTVPEEWLGTQFLLEAEQLMHHNPTRYKHEYLGMVTGTGGEVFGNVKLETITDEDIQGFDRIDRGIDWGYASDPFAYVENYYDKNHHRLYIFFEYYKVGAKYNRIAEVISNQNTENKPVIADREPRSNDELRDRGLRIHGAKKGPDSRDHGFTWLQNLNEIIVDPDRCPNAAREFTTYELEKDAQGNWKASFPDGNDHCLTGDTVVHTSRGNWRISDLVGKEGHVHCVDKNKRPKLGRFFDVRKTRRNAPIFEVELSDGGRIRATADHPVLTQGGWKLVRDLTDRDCIVKVKGL